jgi:nucleotide-binding universal stress UspA family protein
VTEVFVTEAVPPTLPEVIRHIVVPLDGSEFSEAALPVAARLADRLDADVHVLSAVPSVDDVEARQRALATVDAGDRLVERAVVVDLDPVGAIHETLRRLREAVACMASHGRGRTAALIGSVASEVVARGRDPVVVVGPMVDERVRGKGVIVCVDETAGSAALLPIGQRWARLLGERLIVVTVAEPVPESVHGGPEHRRFGPQGDVEAYLESLVEPLRAEGDVEARVVWDPISPAAGLELLLRDEPAFLVVVASHARTGLARAVFGSVAAEVVRTSPSPVLVAPRSDARKPDE